MSYMLHEKILPRLNAVHFYGKGTFEDYDIPQTFDGGSWVIEGEFSIYDKYTRDHNNGLPFYKKKIGNKDGDTGYVFPILVCSKSFIERPETEIAAKTVKPIILNVFEPQKVREFLQDKLESMGEVTFDELIEALDEFSWATYDLLDEELPDSMRKNKS